MTPDTFFRLALGLLLVAFVAHRAAATRRHARPQADVVRQQTPSAAQKLAGLLNLLALVATAVWLFRPQWLAAFALDFPPWLRACGLVLAAAGFALLQWAQSTLDRSWSDTPRLLVDQALITTGPYRWVRHPIYTAFLLILSAPLFLSANWLVGLLWLVPTALEVASRVAYEEALLHEQFGAQYDTYTTHTGRLLPRL